MRQDLDTLCEELERELTGSQYVVFRGYARMVENRPEVEWDVAANPDFREFLGVAERLGVRLIVFHRNKLSHTLLDGAEEHLESAGLSRDEHREYQSTLRKLRNYEGFVASLELSFDFDGITYLYHLSTPWFDQLQDLIDELTEAPMQEDDGESLGGFYSQN